MDKIKKSQMIKVIKSHVAATINSYEIANHIEKVIDTEYKSSGGVIGEFDEWASVFAHDKIYKITHTTSEFVVQPLEAENE